MTPEQYWDGSPFLAKAYRKAHKLRIQQRNEELWMQGLYFYNALGVCLSNAFSKKGSQTQKYMEKPIDIFPKTEYEKELEAQKARQKVIDNLTQWKKRWDAHQKVNEDANRKS